MNILYHVDIEDTRVLHEGADGSITAARANILKFWEKADEIALFSIKKSELDELFNADDKYKDEEKRVLVIARNFSNREEPNKLVLEWKQHDESEYTGALINPVTPIASKDPEDRIIYLVKKGNIKHIHGHGDNGTLQEPNTYYATLGFCKNRYYLCILGDDYGSFIDIEKALKFQLFEKFDGGSSISLRFQFSDQPMLSISNIDIQSVSGNGPTDFTIDIDFDPTPMSHGTGVEIP